MQGADYYKRNTQKRFYLLVDVVGDLVVVGQLLEAEKNVVLVKVLGHQYKIIEKKID